ncbi:MAG: HDOD domain-containing protein [Sedimenticola sp.]
MLKPQPNIDRHRLEPLEGIGDLPAEAFEELLHKLHVEQLPKERRLFYRGQEDRWVYYLLEGALKLEWADGVTETLFAGDLASRSPLADQQPRQATATTLETVEYIRIDRDLLEILSSREEGKQYQVEEISSNDAAPQNQLLYLIYQAYMSDKLQLPHLPEIAIKVRQAVLRPDCEVETIARIIQTDSALAAKLVRASNSSLYGVQSPIRTCRNAVIFLGLKVTRDLITSYSLRELFKTRSVRLKKHMRKLWNHNAHVGATCYTLAGMTPGLDPERAMLLGLIHDIGVLPIINYAANIPELFDSEALLTETISALRAQVGAMVLRKWEFGDESVNVAMEAENWQRNPAAKPDYTDLIIAAHMITSVDASEVAILRRKGRIPALRKVARGTLNEELIKEIRREAEEEVADVLQLIN